jgi:hypothetical protein
MKRFVSTLVLLFVLMTAAGPALAIGTWPTPELPLPSIGTWPTPEFPLPIFWPPIIFPW